MSDTEVTATQPASAGNALVIWWWTIVDLRIGIVPIPVFFGLIGLIAAFVYTGKVPSDILANIAILSVGGFACAELGKRLPLFKHVGAGAIFATFVPSYLVYAHLIPVPLVQSITSFTKSSNFLFLFIASIIVGSILGMNRHVLIAGFLKIFVPLATGSLAAAGVGTLVGMLFGMSAYHAFFFVVVPIMAGGVGEGAIPLSIGYAGLLHQPHGALFAAILPPVMLGSLTAILLSGALNFLGKRYPQLTGEGRIQEGTDDFDAEEEPRDTLGIVAVAGAVVTIVALYLLGALAQRLWGWPAPVVMLFAVVLIKLGHIASPQLQRGAFAVYRFFSIAVTYPLLFAIGVAMTPWDKLISALAPANLATIFATVATIVGVGFYVGRLLGMYPIDVAIVNACHSGQGGTGDVAILTAANRIQLMPFAQVATRIGGAITVVLALLLMAHLV